MPTQPGVYPPGLPYPMRHDHEDLGARLYLAMVRHRRVRRETLIAEGFPEDRIDAAIEALVVQGLIEARGAQQWEVLPPESTLPRMAADLERKASLARASADELSHLFRQAQDGRAAHPFEGIQVLGSLEDIHQATADLAATARERIRSMKDRSARTEHLLSSPLSVHRSVTPGVGGSSLRHTSAYDVSVLQMPGVSTVLETRASVGEQIRFADGVPFSAVVVDDSAALVDLSAWDRSGRDSFVVRNRTIVAAVAATVDAAWRLATPLRAHLGARDRSGRERVPLEDRDRKILALLAAGAADSTIARQTEISQRTLERRVRYLMDRLGAATRFQAGVQAGRRGWL